MNAKKTVIGIGIIAGLIAIGIGISKLLKEQVRLLFSYCYRIKNARIKSFKADSVEMDLIILLRNQSDITVDILGVDLDVYIEGVKVTQIKDSELITWKARSVSDVGFNIKFSPKDIFKSSELSKLLVKAAYNYKDLSVRTVGKVSVKHSFIKAKNVPLDITMTIADILKDDPTLEKCEI